MKRHNAGAMKNYERFFSDVESPEPPAGLARAILIRIERREQRVLVAKIVATVCMFGASLVVIWAGFGDFRASLGQSGFLQFGSLLFSDFSLTVANLPEYLLSMIEAFPVFSAAATLGGATFAIWSAAAMFDEFSAVERRRFSASR